MKKICLFLTICFLFLCPVLSYASELPTTELKQNDKGEEVVLLQKFLIDFGFLSGTADGSFGPGTQKALSDFQNMFRLEPTGMTDDNTLDMMDYLIEGTAKSKKELPYKTVQIKGLTVLCYEDGSYFVSPNTISKQNMNEWSKILLSAYSAYYTSAILPTEDVRYLIPVIGSFMPVSISEDMMYVQGVNEYVDILLLMNQAKRYRKEIHFPDINNNIITIDSSGNISSEKEKTLITIIDYDTGACLLEEQEIETSEIDELFLFENNQAYESNPITKMDTLKAYPYYFRYITIYEGQSASDNKEHIYYIEPNTISTKTLTELKKLYAAVCYAYGHSSNIPPDYMR